MVTIYSTKDDLKDALIAEFPDAPVEVTSRILWVVADIYATRGAVDRYDDFLDVRIVAS